jgi:hypothetical protein
LGADRAKQPGDWAFYEESFEYMVFLDPNYDRRGIANKQRCGGSMSKRLTSGDDREKLSAFLMSGRIGPRYRDGFINPFPHARLYQDWATQAGGYARRAEEPAPVRGTWHVSVLVRTGPSHPTRWDGARP